MAETCLVIMYEATYGDCVPRRPRSTLYMVWTPRGSRAVYEYVSPSTQNVAGLHMHVGLVGHVRVPSRDRR